MALSHVPVDPARIERIARILRRMAQVEAGYTENDPTWSGAPGSGAQCDRAWSVLGADESKTRRAVDSTYAAARLGLLAVVDHASSLARIVTDPDLTSCLPVEAVARAAVETAARSWWLVEPRLPVRIRVARYLADELFSAYQAEDMARRMSWTRGVGGFSPNADDIRSRCDELGLSYDTNKSAPMVDNQRRLGSTRLVAALMQYTMYAQSHELVYALTSATTHGTYFALMRGFTFVDYTEDGEPSYERLLDHRQIEPVCGIVITAFAATLRRVVRQTGWGHIRIDGYQAPAEKFLYSMPY